MNLVQAGTGQAVTWNGSSLTVDFRADGGVPLQTVAGLNMTRYDYDDLSGAWRSMGIEEAWAAWDAYYAGVEPDEDVDVAAGKLAILELYYLALYRGLDRIVEYADTSVYDPSTVTSDDELNDLVARIGTPSKLYNKFVINEVALSLYVKPRQMQRYFGILKNTNSATKTVDDLGALDFVSYLKRSAVELRTAESRWQALAGSFSVFTMLAAMTGGILFTIGYATDNNALKLAGAVFLGFALAVISVIGPAFAVATYVSELAAAAGISRSAALLEVGGSTSELLGMSKFANIVGLIIQIGVVWGVFMYQALSGGIEVGTMAFNAALAAAIASTIVILIMFVLSLTVFGFILTAVLGFVDLLNLLLCEAGVSGACFSLVGSVTSALASLIYSSGVTINFDHKDSSGEGDLVRLGSLGTHLYSPDNGFVDGNSIRYYRPGDDNPLPETVGQRRHWLLRQLLQRGQSAILHVQVLAAG